MEQIKRIEQTPLEELINELREMADITGNNDYRIAFNAVENKARKLLEKQKQSDEQKDKEIDLLNRRDIAWNQKKLQLEDVIEEKDKRIAELEDGLSVFKEGVKELFKMIEKYEPDAFHIIEQFEQYINVKVNL